MPDRKALAAAYKQREPVIGIYAIRCATSGQVWVGHTLTLDTVQNRNWFSLRSGGHPNRDVQATWREHGADTFTFEVLEQLPNEELALVRDAALKDRAAHWQAHLKARKL